MSTTGAIKFQEWSIGSTGFSQPCSINSPKYGGSAADINVQDMQDLSLYQDCMPNFLTFDTSNAIRVAYSDTITCPHTKWVIPNDTTSAAVCCRRSLLLLDPMHRVYLTKVYLSVGPLCLGKSAQGHMQRAFGQCSARKLDKAHVAWLSQASESGNCLRLTK